MKLANTVAPMFLGTHKRMDRNQRQAYRDTYDKTTTFKYDMQVECAYCLRALVELRNNLGDCSLG